MKSPVIDPLSVLLPVHGLPVSAHSVLVSKPGAQAIEKSAVFPVNSFLV